MQNVPSLYILYQLRITYDFRHRYSLKPELHSPLNYQPIGSRGSLACPNQIHMQACGEVFPRFQHQPSCHPLHQPVLPLTYNNNNNNHNNKYSRPTTTSDDTDTYTVASATNDKMESTRPTLIRTTTSSSDCRVPGMDHEQSNPLSTPHPGLQRNKTSTSLDMSWSGLKNAFVGGTSSGSTTKTHASNSVSGETSGAASHRSLFARSRKSSFAHSRKSSLSIRSSASTIPNSPELQAMLKQKEAPDLESVNRVIEELKLGPGSLDGKAGYISGLERLANQLGKTREDCKTQLTRAMKARSEGRDEVCRSLCLQIVQNQYSEVATKVYAYNILSTQASPGQAIHFLNESLKLVKGPMKDEPEAGQILGVINMLRESACGRKTKQKERIIPAQERGDGSAAEEKGPSSPGSPSGGMEMPIRRRAPGMFLQLPKPAMSLERSALSVNDHTPRTEKILKWSTEERKEVEDMPVAVPVSFANGKAVAE